MKKVELSHGATLEVFEAPVALLRRDNRARFVELCEDGAFRWLGPILTAPDTSSTSVEAN